MDERAVAAVGLLSDPTRAALYQWVQAADGPATRDAAATAVGISRKLAAFHLDRLVDAGLLSAGPGEPSRRVGRVPKVYRPSGQDVQVSVPPRDHAALADLLLAGIEAAGDGGSAAESVVRVAADRGRALGADDLRARRLGRVGPERGLSVAADILRSHGYQPVVEGGVLRLRNCPFRPLSERHRDVVCGLNHALIGGIVEGGQARGLSAHLVPGGRCCVEIRAERR